MTGRHRAGELPPTGVVFYRQRVVSTAAVLLRKHGPSVCAAYLAAVAGRTVERLPDPPDPPQLVPQ